MRTKLVTYWLLVRHNVLQRQGVIHKCRVLIER